MQDWRSQGAEQGSGHEPTQSGRLLVRPRTAGDILDCGATTIWKLIRDGELDAVYVGSGRRITYASLMQYVEKLRAAGPTGPRKSLAGATMASLRSRRPMSNAHPKSTNNTE
jgi:excisionase family DNA binding protein